MLRTWLKQMRDDVLQLLHMNNEHLKRNEFLLNDMLVYASDVISGYFDPVTQTLQPSMRQICNEITFLAQFDVSLY